ncbi:lipase family protein [Labrys wisconsinensis]|uniref:Fungal lipase-type domain-containing protein n=1 Tax=Labrys wisconsinensis TaxID=425677 RepID=A0ABU0JBU5_9HYPH|nr:lipase family protein [Labrys wisconsinensis]MDQ0470986.1 hypothetical protein [Labrys wisconsinensis]
MRIPVEEALLYASLALIAEDMYRGGATTLTPAADPRLASLGWSIASYLVVNEPVLNSDGGNHTLLNVDPSSSVFFGFVARSQASPGRYVVAVRGTANAVEWVDDAVFIPRKHDFYSDCQVETGFWLLYSTLRAIGLPPVATAGVRAADAIVALDQADSITVVGHSLGSAIGTYLVEELCRKGAPASACLFASPRTGDQAWIDRFQTSVPAYEVLNYFLDVVTHVPTRPFYQTLQNATVLLPLAQAADPYVSTQANIRFDAGCDHHLVCYLQMLAGAAGAAPLDPTQDAPLVTSCLAGAAPPYDQTIEVIANAALAADKIGSSIFAVLQGFLTARPPLLEAAARLGTERFTLASGKPLPATWPVRFDRPT